MNKKLSLHFMTDNCSILIGNHLFEYLYPSVMKNRPIIILCIGTDRSTGDALGPLVGDKLSLLLNTNVHIYGTLKTPIHAKNLIDTVSHIYNNYRNPFVISIDACLGSYKSIGNINLECKPLQPGAALNKNLPAIGDLSITGNVNISGAMPFFILQNTRLYEVMMIADTITKGITHSFDRLSNTLATANMDCYTAYSNDE